MSSYAYFLLFLLDDDQLRRVTLSIHRDWLEDTDVEEHPMEPESRAYLRRLLPLGLREVGPVVEVQRLLAVEVRGPEEPPDQED